MVARALRVGTLDLEGSERGDLRARPDAWVERRSRRDGVVGW
jgi:hypothetical protein